MYISFVFQQAHCAGTEALLLETPQAGVISVHLTVHYSYLYKDVTDCVLCIFLQARKSNLRGLTATYGSGYFNQEVFFINYT